MTPTVHARAFREKLILREALSEWRTRVVARHALPADEHYTMIERHAHLVWDRRESHPTVQIPAAPCTRCGAQAPVAGDCISCVRVKA